MNPDLYQELVRQISSLQKQVDGLVKPEIGRWLDWTPTLAQGVAVAFNITFARYTLSNKTAKVRATLAVTGAGAGGSAILVGSLPLSIANVSGIVGVIEVLDNGVAYYSGVAQVFNATTIYGVAHAQTAGIGQTPNFTLAQGDEVYFDLIYETT